MYVKLDVKKTANNAAAPQGKYPLIGLIDWDDVKSYPKRDSKGVKLNGDIVFKDGKYAIQIYATSSSISLPKTSEGEEDQVGWSSLPEFSHPGSSLEIEEFLTNWTNKRVGVAVRVGDCDSDEDPYYKIYGTPCNPLSLLTEGQDNNEAVKDMIKFQQFRKSKKGPARYYGNLTFAEANLVPVDAVNVDVAAGAGEYQLQDNAAATEIVGLTNAVHGGVYTLIGSGGANPATVTAGNTFILSGGADWQGLAGSRLTLVAFENGDGTFVFFEQSRS